MTPTHTPESSGIPWSRLGLGTGTLASLGRAASPGEVRKMLDAMQEADITVIDTADTYGSGDCEVLLAKGLKGRRDAFVLVTKAGYYHSSLPGVLRPLNQFIKKGIQRLGKRQNFAPGYLASCIDRSLSRLRTGHLDAFLLHDPPADVVSDDAVLRVIARARESGKALLCGVSSSQPETLEAALDTGAFQIIQTPANLRASPDLRDLWRRAAEGGMQLIGNHVFDPGCLAMDGMSRERLMRASAALMPSGSTLLCGTRNPDHLLEANSWVQHPFDLAEAEDLASRF